MLSANLSIRPLKNFGLLNLFQETELGARYFDRCSIVRSGKRFLFIYGSSFGPRKALQSIQMVLKRYGNVE